MVDAQIQTSDVDSSDYELSAMEKDIMINTGCTPLKFKRRFESNNSDRKCIYNE